MDTNPFIYVIERVQPYHAILKDFFLQHADGHTTFYTSTITDAEFLVKHFIDKDMEAITEYNLFLTDMDLILTSAVTAYAT